MSYGKILISSGKCYGALGCRVVYFCHQGGAGVCPELCAKGDPRGICQADVSRNSTIYTLNMVGRKGDLLLNEDSIYRCSIISILLPATKEERVVTKCQGKCSFSCQPLQGSSSLRGGNWNRALRCL